MKRFTVFIAALIVLPLVFLGACEESRDTSHEEWMMFMDSANSKLRDHLISDSVYVSELKSIITHKNLTIERLDASVRDLQRELDELKKSKLNS